MVVKHACADVSALRSPEVGQTQSNDLEIRMRAALKKMAADPVTSYDLKAVTSPNPETVKQYQEFFAKRACETKVIPKTMEGPSIFE
jgi:hypothetical protein